MRSQFDKFSRRTLNITSSVIPEILGEPAFIAVSIVGTEGVNSLFEYRIRLKTPQSLRHLVSRTANVDTTDWLGKEMSVQIRLEGQGNFIAGQTGTDGQGYLGAGVREINGMIDCAAFLGVEGSSAVYEVTLRPWLFGATLATDCKIYQNKTVREVIDEALSGLDGLIDWRLIDDYPKRDTITQFNESTFHFICRLAETWGINYFFEHRDGKHRLVLTDYMQGFRQCASEAYQTVRFHPVSAKIDEEYLHTFVPLTSLTSGSVTSRDFDYTRPRADLSVSRTDPDRKSQHEVYEWHSAHSGHNHYVQPKAGPDKATNVPLDEGEFLARIRLEQLQCHGIGANGSGHLKGMQPGHHFTLKSHPNDPANREYLILSAALTIREVTQETQRPDNPHGQRHEVNVDVAVYPMRGAGCYRPACKTPVPQIHGVQSAIVVGPANQDIWTDALGRIKVQFHWDRSGKADQNSSCWVRCSSSWAGNQSGSVHVPRKGQEVLIAFISGNPDLPVCTGRVYNQNNLPPWQLPGQQALSGIRSRELVADGGNAAGGRSNHLVLDDSEGKIQAQLKSDHQHSQLSLGYIVRIDGHEGRKDERGQGFELRTDGHGAIRAGDGLLISTEAREKAQSHIKDIDETVNRLNEAKALLEQVSSAAQHHQAQDVSAGQHDVTAAVRTQNKVITGSGETHGEFTEPLLVLASPAGIAGTTSQSVHISSGEHTQLTTGRHLSMTTGGAWFASIKDRFALFVQQAGMKLVAAAGKISMQAHNDQIELIASKALSLISQSDWVDIKGKKGVRLHGANCMLEISDETKFFTASPVLFHGSLETLVPLNKPQPLAPIPAIPNEEELHFTLRSHATDGRRYANLPYTLYKGDAKVAEGLTDEFGRILIRHQTGTRNYRARLTDGTEFALQASPEFAAGEQSQHQEQTLSNKGYRALDDTPQGRQTTSG